MWKKSTLRLSDNLQMDNVSIVAAHPWVYGLGKQTENGIYLSPLNAIYYLVEKLESSVENNETVIVLVTGDSQPDLVERLGEVTDVIPLPALTQVKRLSASAEAMSVEKMQIPAPLTLTAPSVPFSVPSVRIATNARIISEARAAASAGFSMDNVRESVSGFTQTSLALLKEIAEQAESLMNKSTTAWVFSGEGDHLRIAAEMMKNIPDAFSVHCAAVMFSGNNLEGIRGMIHEYESDAGA